MPKRAFGTVLALMVAIAVSPAAISAQPAPTGPQLNLTAGQGDGVVSMEGFPADPAYGNTGARVATGTTVTWTVGSDEAHTVTFLAGAPRPPLILPPMSPDGPPLFNPAFLFPVISLGPWDGTSMVSSGALEGRGNQFSLTFAKPGTYAYLCLFHEPMTGTIEVVAPGSAGITTQAAVDQFAASHMANAHDAQVAQIMAQRAMPGMAPGPSGSTVWTVRAGTDWKYGHVDIFAFLGGENLTVKRGDTVVWYIDQGAPHTVTFNPPGAPPLDQFLAIMPDGSMVSLGEMGPPPPNAPPPTSLDMFPPVTLGPAFLPAGSGTFDGKTLFNSGLIGSLGNDASPVNSWSLAFNVPGSYDYVCLLHEQLGMKGTITVV